MKAYRLGDLINFINETNSNDKPFPFYGININKEFMPSVANTNNVDRKKYLVVRKKRFVFSGMQTGRDNCIRIAMYDKDEPILVSPAYETFEVKENLVLPEYFFMYFRSKEKDRMGAFYSDGSVRANLDIPVFCGIEITLPSIDIQKKYVAVYTAMQRNLAAYQAKVDDLKLVCDGFLDKLKNENKTVKIGDCLSEFDVRNSKGIKNVLGLNIEKQFMPTVANIQNVNLLNYKLVEKGTFVFSGMQTGRDNVIHISLYNSDEPGIISPAYSLLQVTNNNVLPEFIMLWFTRKEVDRYGSFVSDGSIRANLDLERFYEMNIPIPDIQIQKSIVQIFNAYQKRKSIAEKMKAQINSICPVLIKGALQEGE